MSADNADDMLMENVVEGIATEVGIETVEVRMNNWISKVYVQGKRISPQLTILTVADIGCGYEEYSHFANCPEMQAITERSLWLHLLAPGQAPHDPNLPRNYAYPTLDEIAGELMNVLAEFNTKTVLCFGEGAGGNILTRFAYNNPNSVLGLVLVHVCGSMETFFAGVRSRLIGWQLEQFGMNTSAENYLTLHRFGNISGLSNDSELAASVKEFTEHLSHKVNPHNLQMYVNSYRSRTELSPFMKPLKYPVLFVSGENAYHFEGVQELYEFALTNAEDRRKLEQLTIYECSNVIEESPAKLAEALKYFIQGIGLLPTLPLTKVEGGIRNRSGSMSEADKPTHYFAKHQARVEK